MFFQSHTRGLPNKPSWGPLVLLANVTVLNLLFTVFNRPDFMNLEMK